MKIGWIRLIFCIITTFSLVAHPFFSQSVGTTQPRSMELSGAETSLTQSRLLTQVLNDSSQEDRINQPLPGTQISQVAVGFMIFGSVLTLSGISLLGVSLYQREQNQPDWQTFTGIGTGMSLAGLTFLVLGISTNPRYNERSVTLP
jgi:hypothetical protein